MRRIAAGCLACVLGVAVHAAGIARVPVGHHAFAQTQTQTAPPPATPPSQTPPGEEEYVVGPRDVLRIEVFREPTFSRSIAVQIDGTIAYLNQGSLNSISVAGLTARKIGGLIRDRLVKEGLFLTNPAVTVTVEQFHSKTFFMSGQVRQGGMIQLTAERITLQQALAGASGPTDKAAPEVLVRRHRDASVTGIIDANATGSDIETTSYNLEDLAAGRIPDPVLRDGDTVYVPRAKLVTVNGEVLQSGKQVVWFKGISVMQALSAAGGPTTKAATNRMSISRMNPAKHKYDSIKAAFTTLLEPEDIIIVPKKYFGEA
jgi:polysaccharide export outer membrane protein